MISPTLIGSVIMQIKNSNGSYNGVIQTSNKNKYEYFNNESLELTSRYKFKLTTTHDQPLSEFVAINITPV